MGTKRVLLKLTGETLLAKDKKSLDKTLLTSIAQQIKEVNGSYRFGIVIGGGNFFRGSKHGAALGLTPSVGHQIGMLATMMNGLIVRDIFEQQGVQSVLFCAVPTAEVGMPISQQAIDSALHKNYCPIFAGGTGNPFFTTDTTAVLRALQINAHEVWKGTNVDGIYNKDPKKHDDAILLKQLDYAKGLSHNLKIVDSTAFAMAKDHDLTMRVFNIFKPDALKTACHDADFGSTVTKSLKDNNND